MGSILQKIAICKGGKSAHLVATKELRKNEWYMSGHEYQLLHGLNFPVNIYSVIFWNENITVTFFCQDWLQRTRAHNTQSRYHRNRQHPFRTQGPDSRRHGRLFRTAYHPPPGMWSTYVSLELRNYSSRAGLQPQTRREQDTLLACMHIGKFWPNSGKFW